MQACPDAPTPPLEDYTPHVCLLDPHGPAAAVGIRLGDVIRDVDGAYPELGLSSFEAGMRKRIAVRRDGTDVSVAILPTKDPIFGDLMEYDGVAERKLSEFDPRYRQILHTPQPKTPFEEGFDPGPPYGRVRSYRFVSYETVPPGFRPAKAEFYISPSPSKEESRVTIGIESIRLP